MLLYLDNAQFAWLERLPADEQHGFAEELVEAGAEIVLSTLHLQEIGQLSAVDPRLEALGLLAPRWLARSTYDVLELEISLSLQRMSDHKSVPRTVPPRSLLLPIDLAEIAETLRSQKHIFEGMRAAFELGAEAEALAKADPSLGSNVTVPTSGEIAEQIHQVREVILSQLTEASSMRNALEAALPEIARMYLAGMKTREVVRHALRVADMTEVRNAPEADLASISVLRNLALRLCQQLGGFGDCEQTIARFNPYECPGFRLKAAVHRARLSHPKPPEAGDQIDEEHLVYGPYVDLMFVDKRTWTFANQEAQRSHELLKPEDASVLAWASDLGEVARVVRATADAHG